ncbi:hypothetical protein Pla52o_29910 [Novipirellula galeiformis]|uniref:Uncharacterized protein n=1 Tax=Novipirellula galeiformis TaxID=2528004 RepID=A0A5C6CHF1_9BACT|nr:hypothetical protein [Novipirellula galeiformis]TWU23455.1 hypothetical protein Pla52o_29910 [Novipirellula galeiformis]
MGKLRSSIIAANQELGKLQKAISDLPGEIEKKISNVWSLTQTGSEGFDTLYIYVSQKIKKEGKSWSDVEKETLRSIADKDIATFVVGINGFQKDALKRRKEFEAIPKELANLQKTLTKSEASLNDIQAKLKKKKAKLFKSKDYKAKLQAYEKCLDSLDDRVSDIQKSIKATTMLAKEIPGESQISKVLDASLDLTLADLKNKATMLTVKLEKKYSEMEKQGVTIAKKFRQAGNFSGELKMMKKMVDDADAMEEFDS